MGARAPGADGAEDHGPQVLHASAVALGAAGLLILGPSGSGKSALALQLMALGARLVSDDRTCLTPVPGGAPRLSAPETIRGLIEARGLGLLAAEPSPPVPLRAVVDLARDSRARLPESQEIELAGARVPCLPRCEGAHFPAALIQYLKGGRAA